MAPVDQVLKVLRDDKARADGFWAAERREPLLFQLGRLYGERYVAWQPGRPADDALRDREIGDLQQQLGMGPATPLPPGRAEPAKPSAGWMRHVVLGELGGSEPQTAPEAILVAGQPGAGKGIVTEELRQQFRRRGGCAVINCIDLETLHPQFAQWAQQDDKTARRAVANDANKLGQELLIQATAARLHLVLDDSFALPDARVLLRWLRQLQYRTTVLALFTPRERSRVHVQSRYDRLKKLGCPGRWIDPEFHDAACSRLVDCLTAIEDERLTDELHVVTTLGERRTHESGQIGGSGGEIRRIYRYFNESFESKPVAGASVGSPPEANGGNPKPPPGAAASPVQSPATAKEPPPIERPFTGIRRRAVRIDPAPTTAAGTGGVSAPSSAAKTSAGGAAPATSSVVPVFPVTSAPARPAAPAATGTAAPVQPPGESPPAQPNDAQAQRRAELQKKLLKKAELDK